MRSRIWRSAHPRVSPHAKAERIANSLEDVFSLHWLASRQVAFLLKCFPQGRLSKYSDSQGAFSEYGSYRVRIRKVIF